MNCKNCGEKITGNFCNHCGQNSKVGKITRKSLLNELSESIFQVNRGLFFTMKELFVRPGKSIQDYLNGRRKNHFKPIAYVLLFSTIYFLVSRGLNQNTWMEDALFGFNMGAQDIGDELELPKVVTWFLDNFAYSTLLLIPVFSFASYLCFRKFKINFLEHIVLNCYVTGQQAIVYALFSILKSFVGNGVIELFPFFIGLAYTFWVFLQFFNEGNRFEIVIRTILTYTVYSMFCLVILLLIMAMQGIA